MPIIYMDGFEDWATIGQEYENFNSVTGPSVAYGRNGSKGITNTTGECGGRKNLPAAYPRLGAGIASKTKGTLDLLSFHNNGGIVGALRAQSDGAVSYRIDQDLVTLLGTSAPALFDPNEYHHFFIDLFAAAAPDGWIKAYVDGNLVLDISGIRTWHSSNQVAPNQAKFITYATSNADDFYVTDDGFYGDLRIFSQYPISDGDAIDWAIGGSTPAATRWQSVNEITPDDAVTLVESGADGSRYLAFIPPLPVTTGVVRGAGVVSRVLKTDAGFGNIKNSMKVDGVLSDAAARGAPTGWGTLYDPAPIIPTLANLNNGVVQIGVKHEA